MTLKQKGFFFGTKKTKPDQGSDLRPHQQRVVNRMRTSDSGLVVMHGLGSGKTRTALAVQKELKTVADVIAPAALHAHWKSQAKQWKTDARKLRLHSQQKVSRSGYEGLAPLVVVDEGHHARNPKTKLATAISGATGQRRLILTGTPIYNQPGDLGTLVNQAAGKKVLPEGQAFTKRYLEPGRIRSFFGQKLSHAKELAAAARKYVDYHHGGGDVPEVHEKTVRVAMGKHQSQLYKTAMGEIPRGIRVGSSSSHIDEKALARLRPYLTGPRMVSNTTASIGSKTVEEPKITRAVGDLKEHLKHAEGKALVYSNWLKGGINRYQEHLDRAKIPYATFTGKEKRQHREQAIKDFNTGRKRVLLVSSSGGEGLDLKGTRLVQVLEPHFNRAKIQQVVGRAARIGSHSALPPGQQNVQVVHYVAHPQRSRFGRKQYGVDDWLSNLSSKKTAMHNQLTHLISKATKHHD